MSVLSVYDAETVKVKNSLTRHEDIAATLASAGVKFERWQATQALSVEATGDDILSAYQNDVERLKAEYGFQSADVVSLHPEHPDRAAFRAKFLDEHTHSDFEVRFFVDGRGLFFIHIENHVYAVLCEKGDLISVPAQTKHWFDMGARPDFKCIRLFTSPEGWVADLTGDEIAKRFPTFEDFVAVAR